MKVKILKFLILFIICIDLSLACTNQINYLAAQLKGDTDLETAYNIDKWVEDNTFYEYSKYKRRTCDYLNMMVGDCTDKARLKQMLLKKNNITSRTVHGYNVYLSGSNTLQDRHDWYEFLYEPSWTNETYWATFEYNRFDHLKKIGNGIW